MVKECFLFLARCVAEKFTAGERNLLLMPTLGSDNIYNKGNKIYIT